MKKYKVYANTITEYEVVKETAAFITFLQPYQRFGSFGATSVTTAGHRNVANEIRLAKGGAE